MYSFLTVFFALAFKISRRFYYDIFHNILYPLAAKAYNTCGPGFLSLCYLPIDKKDSELLRKVEENESWPEESKINLNLYEKTLAQCPLFPDGFFGKNLVEIGCGQGGGLMWIKESRPELGSVLGIDRTVHDCLNGAVIEGNAMNIPLEDGSVDIVLNVESSHIYPDRAKFYSEVHRILTPGGYFCYTDICDAKEYSRIVYTEQWDKIHVQLMEGGFEQVSLEWITQNVVAAGDATVQRYKMAMKDLPWWAVPFKYDLIKLTKNLIDDLKFNRSQYFASCYQKV